MAIAHGMFQAVSSLNQLSLGQPPTKRGYSEFASCRLGRRGRSVRFASRKEAGGRQVDPDYLAKQAALQQQLAQLQAHIDALEAMQKDRETLLGNSWSDFSKLFRRF